ncbi:MAG TPA: ABC transporter permease [Solirubrobacteraceae bacterium]|nr:ABC transporter permease [Solirubrobacteraceae bacterium]
MSAVTAPRVARRAQQHPGIRTVYAWELRKLRAQKRTYIGLGAAALVPLIFVVALLSSSGGPDEIPFGRYVKETGLAVPLVGLLFSSVWLFPLITSLVAGDIVSAEDNHGTLKTILTRSTERWQIFVAKLLAALTYVFAALIVFVTVGLVLGGTFWGFDPLTSLSGTQIPAGRGMLLIGGSALAYFIPLIAIASIAFLLSTVTHNSAAAVVGTLILSFMMQLLAIISGLDFMRPYLLSEQFDAWQGLLRDPTDWAPIAHAGWVSACYAVPALLWAFVAFVRRDVAG